MISALLLALIIGVGAATGQRLIVIAIAGAVGGLAVLTLPTVWTLWFMVITSFVVVGPLTYFAGLRQLQWLPALFGLVLYLQAVVLMLRSSAQTQRSPGLPGFAVMLALFGVSFVVSSLLAGISVAELIMASRYYIFPWGALMIFLVGAVDEALIDRLWKGLLVMAPLQLPVTLYQYVFVASKRATGEIESGGAPPWDAVIGTFPGTDTGGGNSAAMGFYLLIMLVLAVALWRSRQLPRWFAVLVVLCSFGAIALAEVKAIVLLIPVTLAVYYRKELMRKPLESLAAVAGSMVLALALLGAYQSFHYDNRQTSPLARMANATVYDRMLNALDPETGADPSQRMGRVTHLVMWWEKHVESGDMHHALLGHGIGTTQFSVLGTGSLVRQYGTDIGRSTLVILLWETGLVGVLFFTALLVSGAILSARLSGDGRIPERHRIYLRVGAIALMLFVITMVYKPFAIRLTSIQLLIVLLLGQSAYWRNVLALSMPEPRFRNDRRSHVSPA